MKTKLYYESSGDPSVGMQGAGVVIDLGMDIKDIDQQERTWIREDLTKVFDGIMDDKGGIRFDDECGDCGVVENEDGTCPNDTCIRNLRY